MLPSLQDTRTFAVVAPDRAVPPSGAPGPRPSRPAAAALAAYALACYALFVLAAVAFVAFLAPLPGWRGVDTGAVGPVWPALVVDLLLVALFGVQHSVMARAGFKRRWTRLVPPAAERSTYVLLSSALLLLLVAAWRPVPGVVWSVTHPAGAAALRALFWAGTLLVVASTFAISHAELFGLDRAAAVVRARPAAAPGFRTPALYRLVRHPMQLGFLLTFWAAPVMTLGHLVLALALTGYLLVGLHHEERDLVRTFGAEYEAYQGRVPKRLPWPRPGGRG